MLAVLAEQEADFTRAFRALSSLGRSPGDADTALTNELNQPRALDGWLARWRARLVEEPTTDDQRQAAMVGFSKVRLRCGMKDGWKTMSPAPLRTGRCAPAPQ